MFSSILDENIRHHLIANHPNSYLVGNHSGGFLCDFDVFCLEWNEQGSTPISERVTTTIIDFRLHNGLRITDQCNPIAIGELEGRPQFSMIAQETGLKIHYVELLLHQCANATNNNRRKLLMKHNQCVDIVITDEKIPLRMRNLLVDIRDITMSPNHISPRDERARDRDTTLQIESMYVMDNEC